MWSLWKGVEAGLAEAGRTTLDWGTVHGACEVPSSLSPSRVDPGELLPTALRGPPLLPGSEGRALGHVEGSWGSLREQKGC